MHADRLERAVKRARERNIIIPTYAQMKNPALIPDKIKAELKISVYGMYPRVTYSVSIGTMNRSRKAAHMAV
jgi:hypothetical protein